MAVALVLEESQIAVLQPCTGKESHRIRPAGRFAADTPEYAAVDDAVWKQNLERHPCGVCGGCCPLAVVAVEAHQIFQRDRIGIGIVTPLCTLSG